LYILIKDSGSIRVLYFENTKFSCLNLPTGLAPLKLCEGEQAGCDFCDDNDVCDKYNCLHFDLCDF
jgi:hypothetical protein